VILVLAIGLAGGVGAVARHVLGHAVARRGGGELPLGTLTVNLLGALSLGVLAGLALDDDLTRVVAIGALGSFTTFSTWMFESQQLAERGARRAAVLYLGLSVLAGLLAIWIGRELGELL
jgi:fluoride exporter